MNGVEQEYRLSLNRKVSQSKTSKEKSSSELKVKTLEQAYANKNFQRITFLNEKNLLKGKKIYWSNIKNLLTWCMFITCYDDVLCIKGQTTVKSL